MSLLKNSRPRTQIDAYIVSSSHATRSCSMPLRCYNYSSKASSSSSSPYKRSMVLVKLFTKRCVLSSTTTHGIIAPFNMDVSSSLLSSSFLSPSPGVISGGDDDDDDDDDDNVDSEAKKTHLIRWKVMCSKTCWTSDYGILIRYGSNCYPSSHVKRSYSIGQMRIMMMRRSRRTFSTIGNAHTYNI